MDKQSELLEKEDPRFYAIDKFSTGLGSRATIGKVNNKIVGFGLPSSPALFLSLALNSFRQVQLFKIEDVFIDHPAPQGIWPEDHKLLFDFFELMIAQIVFSFSAIESFANIMIPKDYVHRQKRSDKKYIEEYDKDQIERYLNLDNKLDKLLPNILKVKSPNGSKIWDNYQKHKKLRDRLMHLKSVDMVSSNIETNTIWVDLIRNHKVNYPEQSHQLIGHFISKKDGYRWFKKYPY